MIVVHPSDQPGSAGKAGSRFTGEAHAFLTLPATDGTVINTVVFTPGARTFWHRHEKGQILQVLAGCGRVQAEGGAVQELRAGDTVWCPPGEMHWHGAAPDSHLSHTAISLGQTEWLEPVDDTVYSSIPAERDDR